MKRAAGGCAVVAMFVLAFSAPACGDPEVEAALKALGEGCLIDSDCADPLVCVFRRCHHECEEDEDCRDLGLETICSVGDRPTNVCLLEDEQDCSVIENDDGTKTYSSADCPGDLVCARDGKCRDGCQNDAECLPGQECLKGTCAERAGLPDDSPLLSGDPEGFTATCKYNSDCIYPLVCREGLCEAGCVEERDCPVGFDCVGIESTELGTVKACIDEALQNPQLPGHCADGQVSGDETAEDCGGSCAPCPSGQACQDGDDCLHRVCSNGNCAAPTCSDGEKNGLETAVDCGGNCGPCATCENDTQCQGQNVCKDNLCVGPTCDDGLWNAGETGLDCGGPCTPCPSGSTCSIPGDCVDKVCLGGLCLPGSCTDGVRNQTESDVDCGGATSGCARCGVGADCVADGDCASGKCDAQMCAAPTCNDGVQNGFELGVDCGGPDCTQGCAAGAPCAADSDCEMGTACHPVSQQCTARHTVTIAFGGGGTGSVTSNPAGTVDCTSACAVEVFAGALVLDANPGPNAAFAGFTGDCVDPSTCTLTVDGDKTVTATFDSSGSGIAGWTVFAEQSYSTILTRRPVRDAFVDGSGHLVFGGANGTSVDMGCGAIAGGDFSGWFGRLAIGPMPIGDACVSSQADGSPSIFTELTALAPDGNGDFYALYRGTEVGDLQLQGIGALGCDPSAKNSVIAHYDGSGALLADSAICVGPHVQLFDAAVEPLSGDLIVVGELSGDADLGGGTLTFSGSSGSDMLIARYDASLNYVAAKSWGFSGQPEGFYGVATSVSGTIVAAAHCYGGMVNDFDGVTTSAFFGQRDVCIVQLADDMATDPLDVQWAVQRGSAGLDYAMDVDMLSSGDPVVAITFASQIGMCGAAVSPVGMADAGFLVLDGADGSDDLGRCRGIGGTTDERGAVVAVGPGDVIFAGTYTNAAHAGFTLGATTVTKMGYVAKFSAGLGSDPDWVAQTDVYFANGISALAATANGGVVVAGTAHQNNALTDWGAGGVPSNDTYAALLNP